MAYLFHKVRFGTIPWNRGRKMTDEELKRNSISHLGIKRSKVSIEKQRASIARNPNFRK